MNNEKYRAVTVCCHYHSLASMFDELMDYYEAILSVNPSACRQCFNTQHELISGVGDRKQSLDSNEYME